jgi:Phospholipase_D-nuclease N-terminal/Short C-terminal domain
VSLWDVLVSIFWFMLLFAWIWLLITILSDIFRDHSTSGGMKAVWVLFIIVLPWLGALVYLIARGGSMNERARAQAERQDQAFRQYVQQAASSSGTPSDADELVKLADLHDRGRLSQAEYEQAKAKVLGQERRATSPQVDQQPIPTG